MHRRAIEEDGHPEYAELEHLGAEFQARIHLRRTPREAEVTRGRNGHGLLPRHPPVPDDARSRLERRSHPRGPLRVVGDVMDLVAHHVDLGRDALLREQGGKSRHLERVPQGCELARIDESQGRACVVSLGHVDLGRGHDRAPQHAPAARAGDARLDQGAQLLGLAQHPAAGGRDGGEPIALLVVHVERTLRDVGEIGPEAAVQSRGCRSSAHQPQAAHHDKVGMGFAVEALDERDGFGSRERRAARGHPGLEGIHDGDRGQCAQGIDEAPCLHGSLEEDTHVDPRTRQCLAHRLNPDGRSVEDVEVDVSVDDRAQSPGAHGLTRRASVGWERAGWPRRWPARRSSRSCGLPRSTWKARKGEARLRSAGSRA